MAAFKSIYNKGINQDASRENYPQGMYFNLENGRLITDTVNSDGNITTPKGNLLIEPDGLVNSSFPTRTEIISDLASADNYYLSNELISDLSEDVVTKAQLLSKVGAVTDWDNVRIVGSCNINDDLIVITRLFKSAVENNDTAIWRLTSSGQATGDGTVDIDGTTYQMQLIYIHGDANEYLATDQIKIEMVGYYESNRIQNIYWADRVNSLRKLNITEPGVFTKDRSLVDVITETTMTPPRFIDMNSNGQLYVGQAQYAYRYDIPNGQQTYFSLPSPLIHLSDSDEKANDAGRQYKGSPSYDTDVIDNSIVSTTTLKNSTKSITIQINDIDARYEYIEIVRIHYTTLSSDPTITSIYQGKFTDNFQFTDYGTTSLDSYSLAQYILFNVDFIPQTIAVKDNILFAGNIEEKYFTSNNFDDFDTRAFRYDSTGNCRIYESTDEQLATPEDNDAQYRIVGNNYSTAGYYENNALVGSTFNINTKQKINAVNRLNNLDVTPNQQVQPFSTTALTYDYKYRADGATVGGEGPNIKYQFITKGLTISEKDYTTPNPVRESDQFIIDSKNNLDDASIGPDNYGSPYNAAYYKQYKRNEIYRFAFVVFDKKGIPSQPKWIGDIRTPVSTTIGVGNNAFDIVTSSYTAGTDTCTANALGIEFNVDFNGSALEDEIGGYAIVRCERDANRTNLGQGLLSNLRYTSTAGTSMLDGGGACATYDSLSANVNALWYAPGVIDNTLHAARDYWGYTAYDRFEWISPEASFNTNLKGYNGSYLQAMGCTQTDPIEPYLGVFRYNVWENTSTYNEWGIDSTLSTAGCRMSVYYNTSTGLWDSPTFDDGIAFQYFNTFSSLVSDGASTPVSLFQVTASVAEGKRLDSGETALIDGNIVSMSCSYGGGNRQLCAPAMYFQLNEKPLPNTGSINGWDNNHNYWMLADYVRPAIPYGGYEYTARELNTYYFCDNYVTIANHIDGAGFNVFGGDTFIGYYQHVRSTTAADKYDAGPYTEVNTGVVTFPCESTINMNLRNDSYIPTYSENFNINMYSEVRPDDGMGCYSIANTLQLEDLYLYNTIFSKSDSAYTIQGVVENENRGSIFNTRVMASEQKSLGESSDSWTKFGSNEFLELNTTSGEITKLIANKDSLYCFQSEGISRLAINEKSTIQDDTGQSIVLGTGGVLPYATYITKNSGTNHKWSVVSTPSIIWYYDSSGNKLSYVSDGDAGISDVKGLFSYMENFDKAALNDVTSVYDPKYRELHTMFDFSSVVDDVNDNGVSIIFSDKTKSFTGMNHYGDEYKPFMYFTTPKLIFSNRRDGNAYGGPQFFVHNLGEYNTWYNIYVPLKLTLLLNPFKDKITILDSIEFNSLVINPEETDAFDKIINDETITSIRVYNDIEDTGTIDLTSQNARDQLWIRRIVRKWRYNYFRNNRANASSTGIAPRLRNSYFMVELTFDSSQHSAPVPRYFELGNIVSYNRNIATTQL